MDLVDFDITEALVGADICGLQGLWDGHTLSEWGALMGVGRCIQPLPLLGLGHFCAGKQWAVHPARAPGDTAVRALLMWRPVGTAGTQRAGPRAPLLLWAAVCFSPAWGSGLLTLGLSFLICKMGRMACVFWGFYEEEAAF